MFLFQSDIWALAVIVYEMATLERPFDAMLMHQLVFKIVHGGVSYNHIYTINHFHAEPALVAQSDARPTGDQEIVGSIHAGSRNILLGRLIMKIFSMVILSLLLIQEG